MKQLLIDNWKLNALFREGKVPIYVYFEFGTREHHIKFDVVEREGAIGVIKENPLVKDSILNMTEQEIHEGVRRIFAEKLNVPLENIASSTTVSPDLGLGSLEILDVICGIEDTFDISFPYERTKALHSVGECQNLCAELIKQKRLLLRQADKSF